VETLETIFSGAAAPAPAPETPTTADGPALDGPVPGEAPAGLAADEPSAAAPPAGVLPGYVPTAAIRAEREENRTLKEELASLRGRFAAMQGMVGRAFQPPQAEGTPSPDFFENPEAATRHALAPEFGRVEQVLMHNARLVAGSVHGADKVEAAQAAFDEALQGGQLDELDYRRVMSSPNPFAAAVAWHQRQAILSEIGSDPASYRARIEADAVARVVRHIRETGQIPALPDAPAPQPVQPSAPVPGATASLFPSDLAGARSAGGRAGPAYGGPPSLTDIFKRT
jgi:hypothetical protein